MSSKLITNGVYWQAILVMFTAPVTKPCVLLMVLGMDMWLHPYFTGKGLLISLVEQQAMLATFILDKWLA